MASEAKLDQIVKGAPPPSTTVQDVAAAAHAAASPPSTLDDILEAQKPASHTPATDPLSSLPSSPPQIYLNLLILEASLRAQYLSLRARRRQHMFFLTLLAAWNAYFGYVLFLRPREDGKGVGGSPYWLWDMAVKVFFMGGVLTAVLIWATGQWERGVRWPRRWVGVTNRGLRTMNLKVVVIKGPWWKRLSSYVAFLFPYSSFFHPQGSSYHYIEVSEKRSAVPSSKYTYREGYQSRHTRLEDLEPGGDYIKVLLLPKPFSPEFRENWELYRTEYWEKENERRAELRKLVKKRQRDVAKQQGGWLWWTGWRGWAERKDPERDLERLHHNSTHARQNPSRRRRASMAGSESHSRSSSRSSIPSDYDAVKGLTERRVPKKRSAATRSSRTHEYLGVDKAPSPLSSTDAQDVNKRASIISNASSSSDAAESEKSVALLED